MFKVIRASSDFEVILVAETANGGDGYSDPEAKFHEINENVDVHDFRETTRNSVLAYFSGIADGLGHGVLPEKPFADLDSVQIWRLAAKETARRAFEREMLSWRGCDVTTMSDDEVRAELLRLSELAKAREQADIQMSTRPGAFRIVWISKDLTQAFAVEVMDGTVPDSTNAPVLYRLNRALRGPQYCMSTSHDEFVEEVGKTELRKGFKRSPDTLFGTLKAASDWRAAKRAKLEGRDKES